MKVPQKIRKLIAAQDAEVLELCKRIGFGFVMDSAARQWKMRDPSGALTVGPPPTDVKGQEELLLCVTCQRIEEVHEFPCKTGFLSPRPTDVKEDLSAKECGCRHGNCRFQCIECLPKNPPRGEVKDPHRTCGKLDHKMGCRCDLKEPGSEEKGFREIAEDLTRNLHWDENGAISTWSVYAVWKALSEAYQRGKEEKAAEYERGFAAGHLEGQEEMAVRMWPVDGVTGNPMPRPPSAIARKIDYVSELEAQLKQAKEELAETRALLLEKSLAIEGLAQCIEHMERELRGYRTARDA